MTIPEHLRQPLHMLSDTELKALRQLCESGIDDAKADDVVQAAHLSEHCETELDTLYAVIAEQRKRKFDNRNPGD